jgi:intracellular sulfur oxidation DsrE/DsrF family protein
MPDYVYSIKEVRNLLNSAQLEECKVVTTGYGPFTFRSKKIPERAGVWINERLQQLAERDPKSLLSKLGSHHILLVRKP